MSLPAELARLIALSVALGRNPLLTQGSSGNTSVKIEGKLWIKASGAWLARAADAGTLLPLPIPDLRKDVLRGDAGLTSAGAWVDGVFRRGSVETAMHAMLPDNVVIHVHSVNTISWAVRGDGEQRVAERLNGMAWRWIPFVPSGLPLARLIYQARNETPEARVFVLANHGLVVCGETCQAAGQVLAAVEERLAASFRPAPPYGADSALSKLTDSDWGLPDFAALHALATDPVSNGIVRSGFLYPCQVIFLGSSAVRIVDGRGVLVRRGLTTSQQAVLAGLLQVVQRIEPGAPLRYLTDAEVEQLRSEDSHRYHLSSDRNAPQNLSGPVTDLSAISGRA